MNCQQTVRQTDWETCKRSEIVKAADKQLLLIRAGMQDSKRVKVVVVVCCC